MLKRSFLLLSLLFCPAVSASDLVFADLGANDRYYEPVQKIVEKYTIMSAFADNTFRGEKKIDRQTYAIILYNTLQAVNKKMAEIEQKEMVSLDLVLDSEGIQNTKISDLQKDRPEYHKLLLMLQLGLIRTYRDNTFQADKPVTKLGFAVGVGRIMDLVKDSASPFLKKRWDKEKKNSEKILNDLEITKDNPVYPPLKLALEYDLVDLNSKDANQNINRYEAAYFLHRLLIKFEELRKFIVYSNSG